MDKTFKDLSLLRFKRKKEYFWFYDSYLNKYLVKFPCVNSIGKNFGASQWIYKQKSNQVILLSSVYLKIYI